MNRRALGRAVSQAVTEPAFQPSRGGELFRPTTRARFRGETPHCHARKRVEGQPFRLPSATRQSPENRRTGTSVASQETHGFAPLPRGRFAFIVCNHCKRSVSPGGNINQLDLTMFEPGCQAPLFTGDGGGIREIFSPRSALEVNASKRSGRRANPASIRPKARGKSGAGSAFRACWKERLYRIERKPPAGGRGYLVPKASRGR